MLLPAVEKQRGVVLSCQPTGPSAKFGSQGGRSGLGSSGGVEFTAVVAVPLEPAPPLDVSPLVAVLVSPAAPVELSLPVEELTPSVDVSSPPLELPPLPEVLPALVLPLGFSDFPQAVLKQLKPTIATTEKAGKSAFFMAFAPKLSARFRAADSASLGTRPVLVGTGLLARGSQESQGNRYCFMPSKLAISGAMSKGA